jgi:hypothetical protein
MSWQWQNIVGYNSALPIKAKRFYVIEITDIDKEYSLSLNYANHCKYVLFILMSGIDKRFSLSISCWNKNIVFLQDWHWPNTLAYYSVVKKVFKIEVYVIDNALAYCLIVLITK